MFVVVGADTGVVGLVLAAAFLLALLAAAVSF